MSTFFKVILILAGFALIAYIVSTMEHTPRQPEAVTRQKPETDIGKTSQRERNVSYSK